MEFVGTIQGSTLVGGSDRSLHVTFYSKPVQDGAASKEAGRPIFKEREYVQILIPGDKNTEVNCPATDEHRRRFGEQYAAYKSQNPEQLVGTPLEEVPWLTKVQIAEMKALHIHTLENLAGLSDGLITKIGLGARELVNKAKAFLDAARDSAVVTRQQDQIDKQAQEIARLQEQLADLSARHATPEQKAARRNA